MKKLITLLLLVLVLGCTANTDFQEETTKLVSKKPNTCVSEQAHPTGEHLATVELFANNEWTYFDYYEKWRNTPAGIVAVNFKCEPCPNCYGDTLEFNYNLVSYEIDIVDENDVVVHSTCFNMRCYVSEVIKLPKQLASGRYQVVFTNFSGITKEFYFTKP